MTVQKADGSDAESRCDDNMDDITQVAKVLIENGADVNARDVLLCDDSSIEVYETQNNYHFLSTLSTSLLKYGPFLVTGTDHIPPEIFAFITSIGCNNSTPSGLLLIYI